MPTGVSKSENEKTASLETQGSDISPPQNGHTDLAVLRDLIVQAEEVGKVLPAAISGYSDNHGRLAEATLPIVEENIRQSVKRHPEILTESLFPVIGPTIRKAIAEALGAMVQSLNQTLEHSFSVNGLKWRFEAWQTGKPFAEVVLLKSLIYRVEEVFLIHRETGILLRHVSAHDASANAGTASDGDMISGMLTAIQDFVRDSFKTSENATLDALSVNDLSVWIERSPDIVLAAVIRGSAPVNLRSILETAAGDVQTLQENDLRPFAGNTLPFERSQPLLEECLRFQLSDQQKKRAGILTPFNILAGILGVLLIVFGFIYVRDYFRWSSYLARLKSEPGIVVTSESRGWFKDSIMGLRDPLAVDPDEIVKDYGLERANIDTGWKNYQDLSPQFVLVRAKKLLHPPETLNLELQDGLLVASGTASLDWIDDFRKLAPAVPGVTGYRLVNEDVFDLARKIENEHFNFKCLTTDFIAGQDAKLDGAAGDIESLLASPVPLKIHVVGAADPTGTDEFNLQISTGRAEKVMAEITRRSAIISGAKDSIEVIGSGSNKKDSLCEARLKVLFGKR